MLKSEGNFNEKVHVTVYLITLECCIVLQKVFELLRHFNLSSAKGVFSSVSKGQQELYNFFMQKS